MKDRARPIVEVPFFTLQQTAKVVEAYEVGTQLNVALPTSLVADAAAANENDADAEMVRALHSLIDSAAGKGPYILFNDATGRAAYFPLSALNRSLMADDGRYAFHIAYHPFDAEAQSSHRIAHGEIQLPAVTTKIEKASDHLPSPKAASREEFEIDASRPEELESTILELHHALIGLDKNFAKDIPEIHAQLDSVLSAAAHQ
jgi:hypothetical protein